jgi:hypothetical protein
MRMALRLVTRLFCILGLGGAIAGAQSPQAMVLFSSEIFILDQGGAVSSVQVLDRSSGAVTKATSATQIAAASSWWDVVFRANIFKVRNPPGIYDVLYNVGDKAAPPLQVSLSTKLNITIGTIGTTIRDYWLGTNIALKIGDQYLVDGIGRECDTPATGGWRPSALKDKSKTKTLHGQMQLCTASLADARRNPAALGTIRLRLDYALVWRQNGFTIDPADGNSIVSDVTVDQSLGLTGEPAHVMFADGATFNP